MLGILGNLKIYFQTYEAMCIENVKIIYMVILEGTWLSKNCGIWKQS